MAVDVIGTQREAARVLGVVPATVSQWVSGEREVEWHVVLAALQRTCRRAPSEAPRLMEALAELALDQAGTWVPDLEPDPNRSSLEHSNDITEVHGRVVTALRQADEGALRNASRDLVRSTVQYASALGQRRSA